MFDPEVLREWGIVFSHERPDIIISGSPERADFRIVIEDAQSILFVVEAIKPQYLFNKRRIANIVEQLYSQGLKTVMSYLRTKSGQYLYFYNDMLWQIVPYIPGIQLSRPGYVLEHWRGEVAADFLISLRNVTITHDSPAFSLIDYIDRICVVIGEYRPDILLKVEEMALYVRENLYSVYVQIPSCFAHGDFHALNIIWKEKGIAAVIDWEFCGVKPELYDAANMVSCLGFEDPEALWTGAVLPFLARLQSSGVYSDISIKHFVPLMIALRFAWLSEWLRKKDDEMIRMEFDYFDILVAQSMNLSSLWWK